MNIFFSLLLTVALWHHAGATEKTENTSSKSVSLTLDVADTPEKMAWGLMDKTHLDKDHGMLFIYNPPRQASIWMFNVHIDLAVAFIDEDGTIKELHEAQAFPFMLGPQHRVSNVYALSTLSRNDPVIRFFVERSIQAKSPIKYVLEMNKEWFTTHQVHIGDTFEWKPGQRHATIQRLSLSS